ncbi:MAG: hypothetical protein ACRD2P_11120 [Terriglobia bacterium]
MTSDSRITRIERQVLAALCQGFSDGPLDDSVKQSLTQYRWREPDHQAIFNALAKFPSGQPAILAAELPARLTRLGFPDIDCEDLYQPHGLNRNDAAELIRELLADNKK